MFCKLCWNNALSYLKSCSFFTTRESFILICHVTLICWLFLQLSSLLLSNRYRISFRNVSSSRKDQYVSCDSPEAVVSLVFRASASKQLRNSGQYVSTDPPLRFICHFSNTNQADGIIWRAKCVKARQKEDLARQEIRILIISIYIWCSVKNFSIVHICTR